jgi:hypothetical protein
MLKIREDKSGLQLKISAQNIKSSSDLSGELFCCPYCRLLKFEARKTQSSSGKNSFFLKGVKENFSSSG